MDASTIISIITTKNELKVHVTPSAKKNEIIRWEESVRRERFFKGGTV